MNQWFFNLLRAFAVSALVVFSFAACEGDGPADPGKGGENVDDNGNGGGGSGSVDFTYVNIYPQASYTSWLEENGLSGSDWYDTPDKWGGDVTNAYMYNKGKDQPLRFPAGFDPYLNLREQTLLQSIRPVTK